VGHHADAWEAFDEPVVGSAAWQKTKTPSDSDESPQRIGHCLIRQKIGEGGMGVVYLAEQENPRRDVGVKVIRTDLLGRDVLQRFDLKASLLGRLQHPNIAQIYEAGLDNDPAGPRPFLAMEFVDGPSLSDYTTLGEDHPDTLKGVGNLAAAYSNVGRLAESLRLMEQVTQKRREKLGPDAVCHV
jgi:serine/threonine protein kinase